MGVTEQDDRSGVTDPRISLVCVTASPFGKAALTFTYDDARVWARVRACAHVCVSSCNFGGHTSQPLRRASFPTLTMRLCIKYLWTFRQKYNVTLLKRLSFIMIHVCLKDFRHQLFRKANKWEGCSKDSEWFCHGAGSGMRSLSWVCFGADDLALGRVGAVTEKTSSLYCTLSFIFTLKKLKIIGILGENDNRITATIDSNLKN